MTGREFADHLGITPGYVSKLKKAGRLVLQGKRIVVDASKARIDATSDPAREYVKEHNAAERARKASDPATPAETSYASARARRELALAEQAELDLRKRKGELCDVQEVERAFQALAVQVRTKFEALPDRTAPEVTALQDEARTHALLAEAVEDILADLAAGGKRIVGDIKAGGA